MSTTLSYSSKRNPVISLIKDDEVIHKIACIGDPHLGRVFKTGVPSDRVGEREKSLYNTFHKLMNPTDPLVKDVVVVGDLFDKFIVSPTVVLTAYNIILKAYNDNPNVRYTIIPGNHDLSKDTSKKSSYELLYNLLFTLSMGSERLITLLNHPKYVTIDNEDGSINTVLAFDCYNPFPEQRWSFEDMSAECWKEAENIITFGHWDSLDIIESGYTPSQELLDGSTLVVSGHEHSYKFYNYPFDVNNNPVLFTGSMQPYSHAEDPEGWIYVTIDQDELVDYDLSTLKYKCVRIYCDNTFALTTPIDCLSLSYLYKESEIVEDTLEEDIQSLDDSYTARMTNIISALKSDTGYEEDILEIFKEKGYLNVSN